MRSTGTKDGLAVANRQVEQVDRIFTEFGVTHTFETYEEDHTNRFIEPIEMKAADVLFEQPVLQRAEEVDRVESEDQEHVKR